MQNIVHIQDILDSIGTYMVEFQNSFMNGGVIHLLIMDHIA